MRTGGIVTCAIALAVAGCASGTEKQAAHHMPVPQAWSVPVPGEPAIAAEATWWSAFGSAALSSAIERARAGSFDLAAAAARVRQAQAGARIAGAALLPELSAAAGAGRGGPFEGNAASEFSVGLSAAWEVDIWGRNRALRRAALASLEGAGYTRDAVDLLLSAETASTWMAVAAARERREIAGRNLEAATRILALVEARHRAGAANELELAQQRGLVAGLEQRISAIERDADSNRIALAVLGGEAPQAFEAETGALAALALPPASAPLPSDVLLRRPDIAAAERALAAANADLSAARAAMLPRIVLNAGVGAESGRLSRLFDDPLYSLAAGLSAPIFSGGRLAGERDLAAARREELLAAYRAAIVRAFGEVEQAFAAIASLDRQRTAQAQALEQAGIAARLAESRYRAGADTLLTMLDAQRTLYAAQEDALTLHHARLEAAVELFRALGGG